MTRVPIIPDGVEYEKEGDDDLFYFLEKMVDDTSKDEINLPRSFDPCYRSTDRPS